MTNEYKLGIEELICTYIYHSLKIENNNLRLNYSFGEGVEATEYIRTNEDILFFSLDELYIIISLLKN
jgi:hypothetical protein